MRRRTGRFLAVSVLVVVVGGMLPGLASCTEGAGSCKSSTTNWNVTCGNRGAILPVGGIPQVYVNPVNGGAEAEACNDEGANISQGRVVVRATTQDGVRISLDSTQAQNNPPANVPPGFITVWVGPNGVHFFCAEDSGQHASGDGYSAQPQAGRHDGAGVSSSGQVRNYNESGDKPLILECIPAEDRIPD